MFCEKCGRQIENGLKYCTACGTPVMSRQPQRPAQPPQAAAPAPVAPAPAAQAPAVQAHTAPAAPKIDTTEYVIRSQNRKVTALLILNGILIVIIAVAVAGFFAMDGMKLFEKETEAVAAGGESTTVTSDNGTTEHSSSYEEPTSDADFTEPDIDDTTATESPTPSIDIDAPVSGFDDYYTSSGLVMPASGDYEGICEAYNKAVNGYRAYTGTVTTTRVETVDISAKDIPKVIEGVVNGVIQNFLGTTEHTWTFEDGVDIEDSYRLIGHNMMPYDRDAAVTASDLTAAEIVENSDGGYTITLTFVAETSEYDGMTTVEPVHHMTAMDPLNIATIDISPLEISSATMNYPGATVELTVDGQGRLVRLHNNLPVDGNCVGGYKYIEFSLGLEGAMDSTYEMVYG